VASSAFDIKTRSRERERVSGGRLERAGESSPFALRGIDCRPLVDGTAAIAVEDESMAVDALFVDGVNVRADAPLSGILVSGAAALGGSSGVGVRAKTIVGSRKRSGPASRKLAVPESRKLSGPDSRPPSDRGRSRSCRLSNSDGLATRGDSL
jgi:hypothetical protein